jgi:hypothetical protein
VSELEFETCARIRNIIPLLTEFWSGMAWILRSESSALTIEPEKQREEKTRKRRKFKKRNGFFFIERIS